MHLLFVMIMAFVQAAKGGKIFGNDHLRFLRQGSNNISTTHDTTTATRKMQESQEQLTCIFITTGTNPSNDGYLDVLVNVGNGYNMVTTAGILYQQGEVVLDECYANLVGVQVTNNNQNDWTGSILSSLNNNDSPYSAMKCLDCTGPVDTAESIVVDGNSNGSGDTECLKGSAGNVCTLINTATLEPSKSPTTSPAPTATLQPTCLRITTGTGTFDNGYLDVSVNKGDGAGYIEVTTPDIIYEQGSEVLDMCYIPGLVGVKVTNSQTNAWAGKIETSVNNKGSYSVMKCIDCTGTVDTTEYIVVDGNSDGSGDTKCLDGSTGNSCTLINLATLEPTREPTTSPSLSPVTEKPTISPSSSPTDSPSANPTSSPTISPSDIPTNSPSAKPTLSPSRSPTDSPSTDNPTSSPSYEVSKLISYPLTFDTHIFCTKEIYFLVDISSLFLYLILTEHML